MDKLKEVVGKNGLYIKLGAIFVGIIGCFFEFARVTATFMGQKIFDEGVKYTAEGKDGRIVLVLLIVAVVLLLAEKFAKDIYEKIPKSIAPYGPMGLTGVALLITVIDGIDAKSKMNDVPSYLKDSISVNLGIGFWIILVGLVVALAVMVYEKFFMNKAATPAPAQPAPAQPTTEAPVENNQQ